MDTQYMRRCLQLARIAQGNTYPNPLVGCVIVHNGKIIGEGWHKKAGSPHAEVQAIGSVKDKSILSQSTLYVNLEPCNHFGKTPPCVDIILKYRIPKVVVGISDPFSQVAGKGIKRLQSSGCEVVVGVLERECYQLNKRFFTFHLKKRPYIILKWAESEDGFIAPVSSENQKNTRISNIYAHQQVHQIRAEEASILIGTNTALQDNPQLNTRLFKGKNPIRLVIDRVLKIPKSYHLWSDGISTIFFTEKTNIDLIPPHIKLVNLDFSCPLPQQIIAYLYNKQIQSVLVEGGAILLQQFIDSGLWDEVIVYKGDVRLQGGVKAPVLKI